jgi:hypothetical protein
MGTLLVAAAGLATSGRAQPAPAKARKQDVQYQDHPMDIRMCATCSLFEAPKSCKVVEGDVSPKGWCALFALVD